MDLDLFETLLRSLITIYLNANSDNHSIDRETSKENAKEIMDNITWENL